MTLTYVATSYYRNDGTSHKTGLALDVVYLAEDEYPVLSRFGTDGYVVQLPDSRYRGTFDHYFGILALLLKCPGIAGYLALPYRKGKGWCRHYHMTKNNKYGYEYSAINDKGKCYAADIKKLPKDDFILELKAKCVYELIHNAKMTQEQAIDAVAKYSKWAVNDALFLFKTKENVILPNGKKATHKDVMLFFESGLKPDDNGFPWWGWLVAAGAAYLIFSREDQSPSQPQIHIHQPRRFRPEW